MKDKLNELVSSCKFSVSITFNEHTTNYQTIEEYINDNFCNLFEDLDPNIKQEIINKGTIVEIHAYPDTPIGFNHIAHYDLELALDEALKCLNN